MNFGYELWLGRENGVCIPLLDERDMLPVRYVSLTNAIWRARRTSQSNLPETGDVRIYRRLGIETVELAWSSRAPHESLER